MTLVEEELVSCEGPETGLSAAFSYLGDAIRRGMPEPSWVFTFSEIAWMVHGYSDGGNEEAVKERMAEIRAYLPPVLVWEKKYSESYYEQTAKIWGVRLRIMTDRENACRKVVKGMEVVQVPDPDYVAPAAPMVERAVEIVEWVCGDDSSVSA